MPLEDADDDPVKRLIHTRGGNRAAITRLEKEIMQLKDKQLTTELTVRINSISLSVSQKQRFLTGLDEKILEKIPLEQMDKEIDESLEWDIRITALLQLIEELKKSSITNPSSVPSTQQTQATGTQSVSQSQSSPATEGASAGFTEDHNRSFNSVSSAYGVRLPKIELPKFKGDITQFNSFWQAFNCAVHSNDTLSDIHKLNYLMNLLEGPAHRVVAGFDLTEENYGQAIDTLKLRFGKKQGIVSAHMQALLKLQECPSEKVSQLRYIYDKINVHVRGLESLGMSQESYGGLLIPIIMQRMPSEITIQVARKVKEDIWPIKEILEIIRCEIEAREVGESVLASKQVNRQQQPAQFSRRQNVPTTNSFVANEQQQGKCYLCSKDHLTINCKEITDLEQRKTLLQKARRCFKCLKLGHFAKNCDRKCKKCGNGHHQVICNKPEEGTAETFDHLVTATVKGKKEVLLQTARAYAFGEDKTKKIAIDVLFDSGSQRSYVSEEIKKKLSLNVENVETININTFGSDKYNKKKCELVSINIEVENQAIPVRALSYPTICSPFSSRGIQISDYPHLRTLKLADSLDSHAKRVQLLIGADHYYDFVTGDVIKGNSGPVAVSSKLGWLLSGPFSSPSNVETNVNSHLILDYPQQFSIPDSETNENENSTDENLEIIESLKNFWTHESMGLSELVENEETESTESINKETQDFDIKFNGERYEVSLPWRSDISHESLSENYGMCLTRLKALQSRLKRDPKLFSEYDAIFQDQLDKGIIEHVPNNQVSAENTHYLCHHGVVRKDHETTKLRIVFDGSAKSEPNQLSLNDCLQLGENYMPSLFDTLLRFRVHAVAMTADIEKAFLQIEIRPSDRDSLRFLWFDDIHKDNPSIVQLRWGRLAFGLKPSPSILGATIRQHISSFQDDSPEVVKVLSRLYADDMSGSFKSAAEALEIYRKSKEILLKGGFNLHKWKTNNKELSQKVNSLEGVSTNTTEIASKVTEDDQSFTQFSVGPPNTENNTNVSKILGVQWNHDSDSLLLDLNQIFEFANSLPPTKRSLLKTAAKIFDPLGCVSLFTINLKVFFQELCVGKVGWDEPLNGDYLKQYETLISQLSTVKDIKIDRSFFDNEARVTKIELHAFSDASERAYATVVYLRVVYDTGKVSVHFVASKAKVSPIKQQSIPRLELLGANLMAKFVETIRSVLQEELDQPIETYYWVDSMATLCWIKNDKPWKQFVRHRVADILKISDRENWFYCPGPQNPADLPSRGKFGSSLSANLFWWEGPEFLQSHPENWPSVLPQNEFQTKEALEEKVKFEPKVTHVMVSTGTDPDVQLSNVFDISRFSSKGKLLRTFSWVLRFIQNLKSAVQKTQLNKSNMVSVSETNNAEMILIRSIQSRAYRKEIQFLLSSNNSDTKPPLYVTQFNLFVDHEQVLRCRTRINKSSVLDAGKQPILLPTGNHYASLLIQECHRKVFHDGVRETLNLLRQQCWVPRGREMTKKLIRSCAFCKKMEAFPFRTKFAPDLPKVRVDDAPPFTNTGMDFAGPLLLSDKDGSQKYYVCLFTCLSTRAIHLELVESLHVEAFLRAFRRFCAR